MLRWICADNFLRILLQELKEEIQRRVLWIEKREGELLQFIKRDVRYCGILAVMDITLDLVL